MTDAPEQSDPETEFTYKGGFSRLAPDQKSQTHAPYDGMAELLQNLIAPGLETLRTTNIPAMPQQETAPKTAIEKHQELQSLLQGTPQLLALHALTIAAARRRDPPEIARMIFISLWKNHAKFLLEHLDIRWKISALQTFETFGENENQRRCSAELGVFFALTKLYETERLFSGHAPDRPFRLGRRVSTDLPLGLEPYALPRGDLDRNLLGHLWQNAEADPLLRPLACALLTAINRSPDTLFRRLKSMRQQRKRRLQARKSAP